MPGKLDDRELSQLLAGPEIGVLCTVDAEGRPEGSPIWFEAGAGGAAKIYVHVGRDSKKARNVRANPSVSLTVDTRIAPYRGAVLRGTAREIAFDDALHRRVAVRYLGADGGAAYLAMTAGAEAETVLLEISVTSRYTWDYAKGF
ncbi:MAG: pyridoxamine 5'-phosphate oxidase family protein [Candidatus Binatia bacterium]